MGFAGTGTTGEPMAANLMKAGFELSVVAHRSRAPVERLVKAGAVESESVASLSANVDLLVSCVSGDMAVEELMLGDRGVLAGGREGLIVVDTTTISPLVSRRVAAALAKKGIAMLDAPISGGQVGAIAGTLAIMVGGRREAYNRALPALQAMGKSITYIGDNGAALVVKLCNNMIVASIMTAASEALTMATRAGVDPGIVHQVLSRATARGWIIEERLANSVLAGNLQPGFKLSLMRKDMGLALDYGKALGVPMFMSALVHQLYSQALGLGKGGLDTFGICELYTDATGVSLEGK